MFEIVESGLGKTPEAREWMPDALRTAFDHYERNHRQLMEHFPLDRSRDQMLARVQVDEAQAGENAKKLSKAIANVVHALHDVNKATDQALETSSRLAEGATIIANTPDPPALARLPEDAQPILSPKKRNYLNLLGTVGSIIKVLSDVTKIVDSPFVQSAIKALKELWDKFGPF